jgi:hypothetical protein
MATNYRGNSSDKELQEFFVMTRSHRSTLVSQSAVTIHTCNHWLIISRGERLFMPELTREGKRGRSGMEEIRKDLNLLARAEVREEKEEERRVDGRQDGGEGSQEGVTKDPKSLRMKSSRTS